MELLSRGRRLLPALALGTVAFAVTGCLNLFDPIDNPTNPQQLISKARACFDQADYPCALEYYQRAADSDPDTANSGAAFVLLTQAGAGMGEFLGDFGNGGKSPGGAIGKLAGTLSNGGGAEKRLNLLHAYQKTGAISNIKLKGLVGFVASISLISELLGETARTPGSFAGTDLAKDPAACKAAAAGLAAGNLGDLLATNPCGQPSWNKLEDGTVPTAGSPPADKTLLTYTDAEATLTMATLFVAAGAAQTSLSQLGVTGDSASVAGALGDPTAKTLLLTDAGPNKAPGFRQLLLKQGIGD